MKAKDSPRRIYLTGCTSKAEALAVLDMLFEYVNQCPAKDLDISNLYLDVMHAPKQNNIKAAFGRILGKKTKSQ